MIGELECPHCVSGSKNQPLSMTPMSVCQSGLPSMSHAASMPIEPNIATTRRPSVAGVELAWLDFGVPLHLRRAFESVALPQDLSRRLIEAIDFPGVLRKVVHRRDVAIEPCSERLVTGAADGRHHEHTVAPHHGARVGNAGNRAFSSGCSAACRRPIRQRPPARRRFRRRSRRGSRASCAQRFERRVWCLLPLAPQLPARRRGWGGGRWRSRRRRRDARPHLRRRNSPPVPLRARSFRRALRS